MTGDQSKTGTTFDPKNGAIMMLLPPEYVDVLLAAMACAAESRRSVARKYRPERREMLLQLMDELWQARMSLARSSAA